MTHRASIEAAISAFAESGIDFRAPWQCDLDDLEKERFDALHRALSAAVLSERTRCRNIVEKRCEGDMDFALHLIDAVEP